MKKITSLMLGLTLTLLLSIVAIGNAAQVSEAAKPDKGDGGGGSGGFPDVYENTGTRSLGPDSIGGATADCDAGDTRLGGAVGSSTINLRIVADLPTGIDGWYGQAENVSVFTTTLYVKVICADTADPPHDDGGSGGDNVISVKLP